MPILIWNIVSRQMKALLCNFFNRSPYQSGDLLFLYVLR